MSELNRIYNGDSLEVLKTFPDNSIDCCITSPPYYALRDYGVQGQLGLEKTFHEYLDKLIEIFAEVKRVLKPSGTVWVNLGDSYGGGGSSDNRGFNDRWRGLNGSKKDSEKQNQARVKPIGKVSKSLLNIPSRFAIRMTDELGFIQRNEIIWYKRNCMPSSVKDRFTVDFEKIYFFTKSKKYYFEQIKEPSGKWNSARGMAGRKNQITQMGGAKRPDIIQQGRNKRCVWDITTKPYKEAHFATYPEDLVKPMIKAGCPEFVCIKCGKAKIAEYEYGDLVSSGTNKMVIKPRGFAQNDMVIQDLPKDPYGDMPKREKALIGYKPTCQCKAEFTGGIVLDIFAGSGTTLKVAKDLNRNYIGIELNPEYIPLIEKRL